ncbi:MAG: hypothetical protein RLZZ341_2508, partial [Pseudomonadota bacterium]
IDARGSAASGCTKDGGDGAGAPTVRLQVGSALPADPVAPCARRLGC